MTFNTITRTFEGIATDEVACWCSLRFVIPRSLYQFYVARNGEKAGSFALHCPIGHEFIPKGPSDADKLRDELAREKHRTEQARADAEEQRRRAAMKDRQLSARKGQMTKLRKRIGNGVCPCCNRTFTNLGRHMAGQHPEWAPELEDGTEAPSPAAIPEVTASSGWPALKARRVALGLSLASVAEAVGIKAVSLHAYEHGTPSERARRKVAAFLAAQTALSPRPHQ